MHLVGAVSNRWLAVESVGGVRFVAECASQEYSSLRVWFLVAVVSVAPKKSFGSMGSLEAWLPAISDITIILVRGCRSRV